MDRCDLEHGCWNTKETPALPSRVLDIGRRDDEICLLETGGKQAQYICLSHCWGGYHPIQTTAKTLSDHISSLAFATLPKTYQTSIAFARFFGIRYVWIDSLCIIQDDQDDWVRESSQMCEIYENAFLTIAATSSPNCTHDLFASPPHSVAIMTGASSAGLPYHVLASNSIDHPGFESSHEVIVRTWPLLDRAWVLQERLLSPRVLHISRPEIMWECREQTLCECGVMDFDNTTQQLFRGPYSKVSHYKVLHEAYGDSLTRTWHDIVQWYSKLSITYHSDRLPALSGLAKQMAARRRGVQYLAGLWEDSLYLDLLWSLDYRTRRENSSQSSRSKAVHTPSWSWAAINRAVMFPLSELNDRAMDKTTGRLEKVYPFSLAAKCELETSDITGMVRSGTLEITGRAFECTISGQSETWHAYPNAKPCTWRLKVDPQSVGEADMQADVAYFERFGQVCLDNQVEYLVPDPPNKGVVVCVPIARVRRYREFVMDVRETDYALMLRPLDKTGTTYERVGLLLELRESGRHWDFDNPSEMWATRPGCLENLGIVRTVKVT